MRNNNSMLKKQLILIVNFFLVTLNMSKFSIKLNFI